MGCWSPFVGSQENVHTSSYPRTVPVYACCSGIISVSLFTLQGVLVCTLSHLAQHGGQCRPREENDISRCPHPRRGGWGRECKGPVPAAPSHPTNPTAPEPACELSPFSLPGGRPGPGQGAPKRHGLCIGESVVLRGNMVLDLRPWSPTGKS